MSPLRMMDKATIRDLQRGASNRLSEAGIQNAALDARVLLAHVLGVEAAALLAAADERVDEQAASEFLRFVERRAAGEPVARILGHKEFWSRSFSLSEGTLVPRPETETVVEAALMAKPDRNAALRVLDLGVGSGNLLGAVLLERPEATGVAVDRNFEALRTARSNLDALGVGERARFVCGTWGEAIDARFDLVLSNPPYVASGDMAELPVEVRSHDPALALDGGRDGLDAYRAIVGSLGRLLVPGGVAVIELGAGQEGAVADLARDAHVKVNGPAHCDLAGLPRALVLGPAA